MLFEGLAKVADEVGDIPGDAEVPYDSGEPTPKPPVAPKLGPVERKFDSWAQRLLGANSAGYKHYTANRNLWNIALPVAALGTTAMMTNAAANAFSGGGNNNQGGGGSNWASWLLPLGIVGGGLWAWNKFGDRISKAFGEAEKAPGKINQAADAVKRTAEEGEKLVADTQRSADELKELGSAAADKVHHGGGPMTDAHRSKQMYGGANVYDPVTRTYKRLSRPKMTLSHEAVRQTNPLHMKKVHDQVKNSYSYADAVEDTPVVGWLWKNISLAGKNIKSSIKRGPFGIWE